MQTNTKLIHGYQVFDQYTGSSSIPIYQCSTFKQESLEAAPGGCFKRFLFEGRTLVDRDGRRSGVLVEDLVAVDQFCVCLHFYLF